MDLYFFVRPFLRKISHTVEWPIFIPVSLKNRIASNLSEFPRREGWPELSFV